MFDITQHGEAKSPVLPTAMLINNNKQGKGQYSSDNIPL